MSRNVAPCRVTLSQFWGAYRILINTPLEYCTTGILALKAPANNLAALLRMVSPVSTLRQITLGAQRALAHHLSVYPHKMVSDLAQLLL